MPDKKPVTPTGGEEPSNATRRDFIKQTSLLTAVALTPGTVVEAATNNMDEQIAAALEKLPLKMEVNGTPRSLSVEPRSTLLDILREQLDLTGTKKGCDHGQCGACTVHVNGRRVNSCLTLGVMVNGKKVTTIEGLANGEELHPMQEAFLKHDGFQCGYCTPGQIMSAVACIREGHANSEAEIREYMSGNICRCGAYPNIVNAIQEVKAGGQAV
ncbi:(2Fe-2S)-binding protein [Mucilaginibacter pedocola]|uniref:2Fe-2S ferredoxin n=1 Tax=Mucilaginibacter pedocola TaxID=1792845 RepID=A0A1S9P633_9SPHI|nr:(2Fe-2S)-binding protein [Mucilaginibacter pedocola]OOQ56410.1 2Fe-2S ferredoxin [Mucilaginibacter pedocola]